VLSFFFRLENMPELKTREYEAACFLSTVAFTTMPELYLEEQFSFERLCTVLVYGLESSEVCNA
jgi:hypothetical protein